MVSVVSPGEGELIGDSPDRRVEILSDDEAINATWSRFAPGRDGADLHIHRRHTDLFYVLEGELTLRLGPEDEHVTVPAGSLARLPPFVVHGFRNGGEAEVRYLNLHVPGRRFADYMRALRDGRDFTYDQEPPPTDGVRPASEAVIGPPEMETEGLLVEEVPDVRELSGRVPAGHVECLYVLDGALTVAAGERRADAPRGTWLQLGPDTEYEASGPVAVRCLRVLAGRPVST
jgi:quercetin dioxygenase-like cupin family protein